MSVPNLKRTAQFVQTLLGGSQNFEIGSRYPRHAHLGVVLWSARRMGPSSISVSKTEVDCSILSKVIKGSQNLKFRSRDPGSAQLGVRTQKGSVFYL